MIEGERRRRERVASTAARRGPTRTSRRRSSITSSRRTHFPYTICGAQQDNSTLCGPSRKAAASTSATGSKRAAASPATSRRATTIPTSSTPAATAGCSRARTCAPASRAQRQSVARQSDGPPGDAISKYRFQWTFPIVVSPHNSERRVRRRRNIVHRTTNGGKSWTVDLARPHLPRSRARSATPAVRSRRTRRRSSTTRRSSSSPSRRCTPGVIWAGSDDGKVYVTRDGGENVDRTSRRRTWRSSRASRSSSRRSFGECIAYVAANRYQLDDKRPYLWKTTDCGATLDAHRRTASTPTEFTRVMREDPEKRGLLFAGTERGVWFSLDDGANWQNAAAQSADRAGARSRVQGRRPHRSPRTAAASTSWTTSRRSSR